MSSNSLDRQAKIAPSALVSAIVRANNFTIQQVYEPHSGTAEEKSPTEHSLCLTLGSKPVSIIQTYNQQVDRGVFRKGDIVLLPPGEAKWQWQGTDHYLCISFNKDFFEKVALETLSTSATQIQPNYAFRIRDPQIQQIGMMLLSELQNDCIGGQLYTESLMNVLTVHLLRNHSTLTPKISLYSEGLPEHQLKLVIEYLHEYLDQEIKLSDLAALLDMSQFHFSRRFKQSMGVSPHQYLIQQRVERAEQLLKRSDLSIAEIALQCGFNSQSHLGKYFREWKGMTPNAYRKQRS